MRRDHPEGFVLIAVIWFIALLALAAGIIGNWLSGSLQGFAALQDRAIAEADVMSASNQVTYLMVSNYLSSRGLEILGGDALAEANTPKTLMLEVRPSSTSSPVLRLDSRPYRFGGGILELQDNKGLYNLNDASAFTLDPLLETYGVQRTDRGGLLDRLLDYQNKAPFTRMGGANRDAYVNAGRPPPRNAPLLSPWELLRILGWDDTAALWTGDEPFWDIASVSPTHGFNPNTAPPIILRSIPGLDAGAVDKLLEYRNKQPISGLYQMQEITGRQIPLSPMGVSPLPANNLRLKMAFPTDPLEHIVAITLTPLADAPFRIEYVVELPKTADVRAALAAKDVPRFPALADIP